MMQSIPIERRFQTSDQTAPWDGVVFTYEVGSDELDQALRICYPTHRTLRQRKHAAIIQFLTIELNEMQSKDSIRLDIRPRFEDAQSNPHSPAQLQSTLREVQAAASFETSSVPRGKKQRSRLTPVPPTQTFIDSTTAVHASHIIFNAVDGRTMQQKTKRKMTAEERVEYKETRRRGACYDCRRQKGKVCML